MAINTEPTRVWSNSVPLFRQANVGADLAAGFIRNNDVTANGERFGVLQQRGSPSPWETLP